MKCEHCGGSIIPDQGTSIEDSRLKCMSCGREPKIPQDNEGKGEDEKMKNMPIKRDEKGNVIVPIGFIYQPETRDSAGNITIKEHYRRYGYKKEKKEPVPPEKTKRKYKRLPRPCLIKAGREIRPKNPGSVRLRRPDEQDSPTNQVTKATPAEILIALRKGMAAEIVDMIKEKYEL